VPRLGANAAFGAAILYAADPLLIRLSSSLLTDLLFTFLLVAAFYVLSRTIAREEERGKVVRFAIAGLLLGLAALTRPVAQYAPFVLLIFFVLLYKPDWKRAIKYSAAVGVAFMLTITPWIVRNQQAFGRAELSTSGPYGLLVLHIFPMVKGKHPQLSHSEMKDQLLAEADSLMARDGGDPATANPFEKSDYWTKVGLKYVKEDPVGFAWSYVVGLYSLFMVIGAQAFLNMLDHPAGWLRYLIAAMIAGHLFVTYGSALLGLVVGWRRHDRAFLWLALGLALYFIILTGPAGISRYRVPAIPFYLVFSGIGLAYLWDKAVAKRRS
jgi:4-amino-4-deoxy-L-arabinose transferase-like glycosyltransferase